MRLGRWDWLGTCFGLFVALAEFLAGLPLVAVGVLAGTGAWAAIHVRLLDRPGVPGGYATRRARLEVAQTLLLAAAAVAVVALLIGTSVAHWQRTVQGNVAAVALAGLEVLLLAELTRRNDSALNWVIGSRAERAVAEELEPLRTAGWLVVRDWPRQRGGNIDHVVCGPRGAFAIETKSRFLRSQLAQAAGAAAEVQRKRGCGWVQAVICPDDPSFVAPRKSGVIWIVPRAQLREWLLAQPARAVPLWRAVAEFSSACSS